MLNALVRKIERKLTLFQELVLRVERIETGELTVDQQLKTDF